MKIIFFFIKSLFEQVETSEHLDLSFSGTTSLETWESKPPTKPSLDFRKSSKNDDEENGIDVYGPTHLPTYLPPSL